MIRLMGILMGSALTVAMLIVALGLPEFSSQEEAAAEQEILAATLPPPDAPAPREAERTPEPEAEPDSQARHEASAEAGPTEVPETVAKSAPKTQIAALPQPLSAAETEPEPIEQNWYAFWSPFRSEIAADGFILKLQETTGLDYRVVKLKPGTYEVAFAYTDDADIADKLNRISTATGLDMSGS